MYKNVAGLRLTMLINQNTGEPNLAATAISETELRALYAKFKKSTGQG